MALEGVNEVKASASENKAVISLNTEVPDKAIEKAIEEAGYKVLKIKK